MPIIGSPPGDRVVPRLPLAAEIRCVATGLSRIGVRQVVLPHEYLLLGLVLNSTLGFRRRSGIRIAGQ